MFRHLSSSILPTLGSTRIHFFDLLSSRVSCSSSESSYTCPLDHLPADIADVYHEMGNNFASISPERVSEIQKEFRIGSYE